jgi:hypothetical protein
MGMEVYSEVYMAMNQFSYIDCGKRNTRVHVYGMFWRMNER